MEFFDLSRLWRVRDLFPVLPTMSAFHRALIASVLSVLVISSTGFAQTLPSPTPSGVNAAFVRLFGDLKTFSADAVVQVHDLKEKELVNTPMTFALLNGRIRMDLDMANLKSHDLPEGAAASLKQLGMGHVVSLILPNEKASFVIYPGLNAYLRIPMGVDELSATTRNFKMDRVKLGAETIEGHPCVKYRVTVTSANGQMQQATTWNATDLNAFPLQIQMSEAENLMTLRFRNVKFAPPRPDLFTVPKGYDEYEDQKDLLQAVMMKAMGGLMGVGEP